MTIEELGAICLRYYELPVAIGKWFLILGLISALVLAVVETLRKAREPQAPAGPEAAADAGPLSQLIEALKGLVGALKDAPVWLAMVVAGVLLLFAGPHSMPAKCDALAAALIKAKYPDPRLPAQPPAPNPAPAPAAAQPAPTAKTG